MVARSQFLGDLLKNPVDIGFVNSFGEKFATERQFVFLCHDFRNKAIVLAPSSPHLLLQPLDERLDGKLRQGRTHRLRQSNPECILVIDRAVGEDLGQLTVRKDPKA